MRLAAIIGASFLFGMTAFSQSLEEFRAPNELESAYIGVSSALGEASLCANISSRALNRVRKPSLTRSLCYYHTALTVSDEELCSSVAPVPVETGMMAWLDPERCRQQVEALRGLGRPPSPTVHLDTFLEAAGYTLDGPPQAMFDEILADPRRRADLLLRLDDMPDFSEDTDIESGFTEEEAQREKSWVLGRALRLCVAGRSEASCDESSLQLVREDGLRRAGLLPPAELSDFRRATEAEQAFMQLADTLRDPQLCDGVGRDVLSVGWSQEPGLAFVPARSACRFRVAALMRSPDACAGVQPVSDTSLDGARATESECRKLAKQGQEIFAARSQTPDWESFLEMLQYGDGSKRTTSDWRNLAAHLANPLNKDHDGFRARVRAAARWYAANRDERRLLAYTVPELQVNAHQFAATRFHCSLNWADVQTRDPGQPKSYWTPERPSFSLINEAGAKVTQDDFKGRYMLAYFGFTYCPDVCPVSLATIMAAMKDLGPSADAIKPVFFTLDARRDTAPVLATYVKRFGEDFSGLTGSPEAIERAARSFNVYYFAGESDGRYVVEHTSYFYLVDPDGETVKYFEYGVNPHDMAAEIKAIIDGEAPTPGGGVRHAATR